VHFIELDGVHEGGRRVRTTRVIAYDEEEIVERLSLAVPVSRHPVDSINLADPKLGLLDAVGERLARNGLDKGRVDILLAPQERGAGLTVNEYETFLMSHDLAEVLRNPLQFAALRSKHMLEDPRAIPDKTLDYAKYDLVHVFNSLMEAFGLSESSVERLLAKLIGKPAERFLRLKRGVSFAAADAPDGGRAQLVRGTYQSPILVQWRPAEGRTRRLDVVVRRFR